jgi:tRNA threonylcarbamoyladenosine biosynthesis protein TsaE
MTVTESRILALPDEAATARLAGSVARCVRPGDVILLAGPYGAGKTAFARAFLRAATGDPDLVVPSPSFTLVQTYTLPDGVEVWHYDLWRIAGTEEIAELGWDEARAGIALVEWPERLGALTPPEALTIALAPVSCAPNARLATLSGWPDRLAELAP